MKRAVTKITSLVLVFALAVTLGIPAALAQESSAVATAQDLADILAYHELQRDLHDQSQEVYLAVGYEDWIQAMDRARQVYDQYRDYDGTDPDDTILAALRQADEDLQAAYPNFVVITRLTAGYESAQILLTQYSASLTESAILDLASASSAAYQEMTTGANGGDETITENLDSDSVGDTLLRAVEEAGCQVALDRIAQLQTLAGEALETGRTLPDGADALQGILEYTVTASTTQELKQVYETLLVQWNSAVPEEDRLTLPRDTQALERALDQANALDESAYTPDSWAALETARNTAQTVLEDSNADQSAADEACAALTEAIAALAETEGADGEGPDSSETQETGSEGGTQTGTGEGTSGGRRSNSFALGIVLLAVCICIGAGMAILVVVSQKRAIRQAKARREALERQERDEAGEPLGEGKLPKDTEPLQPQGDARQDPEE